MTSIDKRELHLDIISASDVCSSIFDGTHDSPKQQESGFKLVTSRHIKNNMVLKDEAYFITKEDYLKINKRSGLKVGDVLFTMIGTVGEVCRITSEPDFAIKNIGVFRPKEIKDSVWIYYYLISPEGRKNIESSKRGTTQQFMGLKELRGFPMIFPRDTLYRQNQSQILELLDSKIAINNALSKTLEDIAQTIFKSWFIDFDPVKAKMNGEKPIGMDDETAALFPDSFEESELGLIPNGWEAGSIGDLYDLQGGFAFKSSSWTETGVPVIKIGSVKPGFIDLEQVSFVSEQFAITIPDDYRIPAGSLVVGLTGYVGEVGLARTHFPVPLVNQRVANFKSKSGDWKLPFIYCLTRNPKFKTTVEELATGTAQQNVSNSQILSIPIVKPTKNVFTYFEDMLESYFEQIVNLADENETLKTLRDSLLPRLISGELQIPEEMLAS